jgi:hypothetical protein
VILKIVPEAGYDMYSSKNRPIAEKQRKIGQWQRRKVDKNSDAASEK